MVRLDGKVAIVTGASSGVGWQAAVRLAEQGVKVCVTARRQEALDDLCGKIRAMGGECVAIAADVTIEAEVERVVSGCVAHFGRVDILVNNAAVQVYDWFEHYNWAEIDRVFEVTCFGQFRFARAVLPHFRAQGSGHLISVGSMLARGAAPLLSAYTAAKHAVLGWVKSLELELYGSGIRTSIVQIPSVSTPMFDHAPMKLGSAPQPVPPTYDTDIAARAIVKVAKRPRSEVVPVFLQGTLILWIDRWAPRFGRSIMGRFGTRLQMRSTPAPPPPEGNLFEPIERGVGPYGSVPPTPRWKRALATAAIGAAAAGGAAGVGAVARRAFARV